MRLKRAGFSALHIPKTRELNYQERASEHTIESQRLALDQGCTYNLQAQGL